MIESFIEVLSRIDSAPYPYTIRHIIDICILIYILLFCSTVSALSFSLSLCLSVCVCECVAARSGLLFSFALWHHKSSRRRRITKTIRQMRLMTFTKMQQIVEALATIYYNDSDPEWRTLTLEIRNIFRLFASVSMEQNHLFSGENETEWRRAVAVEWPHSSHMYPSLTFFVQSPFALIRIDDLGDAGVHSRNIQITHIKRTPRTSYNSLRWRQI